MVSPGNRIPMRGNSAGSVSIFTPKKLISMVACPSQAEVTRSSLQSFGRGVAKAGTIGRKVSNAHSRHRCLSQRRTRDRGRFAGWDVAAILTLIAQSRDRYNPAFRMVFLWHRRRGERSRSHAHRFAQIKNKRFPLRTLPTSYLCLIGVNGFGIAHHGVCGERIFDAVNSHRRRDRSLVSEISA